MNEKEEIKENEKIMKAEIEVTYWTSNEGKYFARLSVKSTQHVTEYLLPDATDNRKRRYSIQYDAWTKRDLLEQVEEAIKYAQGKFDSIHEAKQWELNGTTKTYTLEARI